MNFDDFLAKVAAEVTHEPCAWGRRVNPTGEHATPCDVDPAHLLALRDEGQPTVYLSLCGEHHEHVWATLHAEGSANFVRAVWPDTTVDAAARVARPQADEGEA